MHSGYSTEAHPAGTVALQDRKHDGSSEQPVGSRVYQHTIVNVPADPPKDHLIWSLFNFVYANICCLGLVALVFSVKARDRKVLGDLDGARHYAATARTLNIVVTVLMSIAVFLCIVVPIAIIVESRRYYHYGNNGY